MFLYDKVIVIDIEATCWEKGQSPKIKEEKSLRSGFVNLICRTEISKKKEVIDKTCTIGCKRILYTIDRIYSRKVGKRRSFF